MERHLCPPVLLPSALLEPILTFTSISMWLVGCLLAREHGAQELATGSLEFRIFRNSSEDDLTFGKTQKQISLLIKWKMNFW